MYMYKYYMYMYMWVQCTCVCVLFFRFVRENSAVNSKHFENNRITFSIISDRTQQTFISQPYITNNLIRT